MAFSYSALNTYGKATLPSTESYGTNMNILRDPPKSIHTRRIDKVGQTSDITQMIDDSGNRACEAISLYTRGINPFVSVSYSNEGNNGGNRAGGLTAGGGTQAYLPYRVVRDGAFRPPVLPPEYLIPQSRQPRVWTTAYSNPEFHDYSKKVRVCGTAKDFREVKTDTLKASVRPTAVYRIEKPISEPFEVKYMIQNTINTSATSGMRTMDLTTQNVQKPTKEMYENNLHAFAQTNMSEDRYKNESVFNSDRYMQDTNAHEVNTNISSNRCVTAITDLLDLSDLPVRDIRTTSHQAPCSGVERNNFDHTPIVLTRTMPEYEAMTNKGQDIYMPIRHENVIEFDRNMPLASWTAGPVTQGYSDHGSRDYRLAPKIQPGGYDVPGQLPMQGRMQDVREIGDSLKSQLSQSVMQQMQSRYP